RRSDDAHRARLWHGTLDRDGRAAAHRGLARCGRSARPSRVGSPMESQHDLAGRQSEARHGVAARPITPRIIPLRIWLPMAGTQRSMARMATGGVDLAKCRRWFRHNRRRSRSWFDLLSDEAYTAQPVALRHPVVFYEGHVAAFNVNTLVKMG